jgi:hypothetical protein
MKQWKNKEAQEKVMKLGKEFNQEIDKMFNLMEHNEPSQKQLNESSLSRVWRYSEKYDMAILSANRSQHVNCVKKLKGDYENKSYTPEENEQRNRTLKASCLDKGYGVTKIRGSYIENFETPQAIEVQEESFVIVNLNNDPNFNQTIINYSKAFCQDCVLLKEVGKDAILYGTNNASFPGLDNTVTLGKFKGGLEAQFMSRVGKSKQGGRPFVFGESELPTLEIIKNYGWSGRLAVSLEAKKITEYL